MIGVCLALLLDASGSVDAEAFALMREGHAAGFRQPAVLRAIEAEGVAVRVVQFATVPVPVMGWQVLRSRAQAEALAVAFEGMPRATIGGTATGLALAESVAAMERAPDCEAQVIDLVTDGPGHDAAQLAEARAAAEAAGVRINALAVRTRDGGDDPAGWLRANAITADGFAIEAEGWARFAAAFGRKLAAEVAAR